MTQTEAFTRHKSFVRRAFRSVIALLLLTAAWTARADAPAEVVLRGKRATALVELKNGEGSAFCIDRSGLFVTNAHVVASVGVGGTVNLVLNPAENDQQVLQAHVLALDKDLDLAVLKMDRPPFSRRCRSATAAR